MTNKMKEDWSRILPYLLSGVFFPFGTESIQLLKNELSPSCELPSEIETFLCRFGGRFFKASVRLGIGGEEFKPLHVMGDAPSKTQTNLVEYLRNNSETQLLPIIKLEYGFIYVRIALNDRFGSICFSEGENDDMDYKNIETLIEHFRLVE